jgi:hypothetical protein
VVDGGVAPRYGWQEGGVRGGAGAGAGAGAEVRGELGWQSKDYFYNY